MKRTFQRDGRFLLLFLVVALCGYLFFSFYGEVKANLIEEFNKRQIILARQAARSIEKMMAQHERTLKVLSADRRIIEMGQEGRKVMETILTAQGKDVRAVTRLDEKGRIIFTVPYVAGNVGKDISYQPHIREVLSKREPQVSDIFSAIQGFKAMAFHYPVYDGERFRGTIAMLIDFDQVAKDLLSVIKVGKTGSAHAINERGIEVYCPVPGHVGRPLQSAFGGSEGLSLLSRKMREGKTGTFAYSVPGGDGEGGTRKVKKHTAYTPALVGGKQWSVAVSTPEEEILEDMVLFRNKLLLIFGVLLAGSTIFSYYSFRARGIIKEEEKRRRTEEALRASEEKYRHIFENSIEGIFQTTPEGRLIMANPALAHMHGYDSAAELITNTAHIEDLYVNPGLRKPYGKQLAERGGVNGFEVGLYRKDGSRFLASLNALAVRDEEGKVLYYEGTAQDITERNEKERELLEKTALLEAQLNASPDGILVVDKGRKILQNRLYIDKVGAPAHGAGDEDGLFIERAAGLSKNPEQYLERVRYLYAHEDETSRDEIEFKDGTVMDRYSSPVIGRNGEHFGRLWIFRDITEKKRTEEELREYEKAVEGSRDIIVVLDRSYRYRAVNQSYLTYREMRREDVIGRTLMDIAGEDTFRAVFKTQLDACFKGNVVQVETRYAFPGIGERDFHVTCLPVMGNGEIDRSVLIMHDITDRKQTEEALRESEEKYRSVVESSLVGFYIIQDNFFQFVNKGFCEIFGYREDEIVGKLDPMLNAVPEDRPIVRANIEKRLSGEAGFTEYEFRTMKKDGTIINVKVLGGSMMFKGRCAATGTLIDVTREKSLEAQLRQSQKMEAIGTLAGGVAHDFNNLLTVLMGYGNLLQLNTDEASPTRMYVDQIMSASQRAANLTRSLLAFSRKQPLSLESHNINDLVKSAGKLFKRLLTEDIEVRVLLASRDMIIMADATQIDQILFNLVTNAGDAMAGGGVLTIETKPVELDREFVRIHGFNSPGPHVLLSVSDTGTGMDQAMKEKIFDPFFTTKPVGKGTGIGLSTVYGIVKQHNGYIYVYSEPGVGTTFHIYLPLAKNPVGEAVIPLSEIKGGTEKVLLAEDDMTVRNLLKAILSGNGYTVIEAVDGEDAVTRFSENRDVDLVILDSVMPRKNGRQAYNEISRKNPSVKVLFTSGYTRDVVLDKGIETKEIDFISKPVSPIDFLRKVREVLDR